MPISFLSQRKIIHLSGDDTVNFLQGLISNDARKLLKNEVIYTALLSPQGKFLYDFFIIPWYENIFLDVAENRAADLLSRLKMYRLRSKVEIEFTDDLCVAAIWGNNSVSPIETSEYKLYQDPRLTALGFRIIGKEKSIKESFKNFALKDEYERSRIDLCVPDTTDMIVEKSLLLEFGFEELQGVDFSKGCYVGQEVTARSKFRGQVRKSIYKIIGEETDQLPAIGTPIISGAKTIGELRTSIKNIGIAIINSDDYEATKNAGETFLCNGKIVQIISPNWR